jgi:hypothetical protein
MVMHLSAAELATLWHPPTADQGDRVERVAARWMSAPATAFIDEHDPRQIAMGQARKSDGTWAPIGFSYDRLRFIQWITAPMGRGKSELLRNILKGLLRADAGFMALDCKAKDLVNTTLPLIPMNREGDVVLVDLEGTDVTGEDLRVSMNLLTPSLGRSLGVEPSMMASIILGIFATLDPNFSSAVGIQQFANMGMLALLGGEPNPTLMHLIRFFGDEDYRAQVCGKLSGAYLQVSDFWERRFGEMPEAQKSSLASFERRLDRMLSFPELQAMLVAPGCSVDLRKLMDNKGILLMGISASQGDIATVAITLLLTQLRLAALSRTNVPEAKRPDWPMIIDEVQIVANSNADLFKVMLSQFRSMRIGQILVHQGLSQIGGEVMGPLSDNAAHRVIFGCEANDAGTYAGIYGGQGLTREDFVGMEVHPQFGYAMHSYLRFQGGPLFSSKPLPMAQPLDEPAPPPVYVDWRTVRAPARSTQDRQLDEQIARFNELARVSWDAAVERLGVAALKRPELFDLYCARTKAHRQAQRQFILDNPGCIRIDTDIGDEGARRVDQKVRRIRVLSALGSGVPRLETTALAWSLLMAGREASEVRKQRAEVEKAAKTAAKKGGGKKAAESVPMPRPARAQANSVSGDTTETTAAVTGSGGSSKPETRYPTFDELAQARGWKREAGDTVGGMEEW